MKTNERVNFVLMQLEHIFMEKKQQMSLGNERGLYFLFLNTMGTIHGSSEAVRPVLRSVENFQ